MGIADGSRPKLADVAEHAGVSLASVSRVVNSKGPVSEAMRKRVEHSMATLGYRRRRSEAAVLADKVSGTVALVIADVLNPVFAETIRGVEEESEEDNLTMMLASTAEEVRRERHALHRFAAQQVHGIILFGSRLPSEELVDFHQQYRIPLVVINRQIKHPGIPCIVVDSAGATYRATRHLLNLNHTQIAYLAGPRGSESSQTRYRGIAQALSEVGLELRPEWCQAGFPSIEGGFQTMSGLLNYPATERPTAVVAYNDMIALGAMQAIRTYGLRVPQDISVIGFDDIAMAAQANPPLTTVALPKHQIGEMAMKLLRRVRQEGITSGEGYVLLESPLVIRESTTWCATALSSV